ncbi:glycosyltransferase [Lentzea sp. CA-135723]|uniref:glycosyltransferase n=1 Tax=Lentzea sp. CA-135723 TaxID=3239950 RepID=UPI003D8E2FE1
MRILLTALPLHSHLVPVMVPLARAFRERGHEAVLATGPAMAHLPHTVALPDVPVPSGLGPPWSHEAVVAFAANVLDFARTWRPDVIVRETSEHGGQIAAEVLGIPHALVDVAPFAPLEIPLLDELVDKVRARFGVAATDPVLTAGLAPAAWHPAQHHFRVPLDPGRVDVAPEIVATFGTRVLPDLLHTAVEALGEIDAHSVVATGHAEWKGPRPANVRLEPEISRQRLLNNAKLFVTHAGCNSVREALTAGVPMVALPLFGDQHRNAARIRELGAGVHLGVKGLTAAVLAERINHVLNAKTYHESAGDLAAKIAVLEDFRNIPDHLVSAV